MQKVGDGAIAPWINPFNASQQIDETIIDGARISFPRGDQMFWHLSRGAPYEPWVFRHLRKYFTQETVFVDVGANIGFFSAIAGRVVKRVIAIEPWPPNVALLQKNFADNGIKNFVIYPVAASNLLTVEGIDLEPGTNHSVRNLSRRPFPVMTIPLDMILQDEVPTLIKIDVEGREYDVLLGLLQTINRHKPVIMLEYSPKNIRPASGVEGSELLRILVEFGYSISNMRRDNVLEPNLTTDEVQKVWDSDPKHIHLDLLLAPIARR